MFSFRKAQKPNPSLSTLVFNLEDVSDSEVRKSHIEVAVASNVNVVDRVSTEKMGLYKTQYVAQQSAPPLPRKEAFQHSETQEKHKAEPQNRKARDNEIEATALKLLDRFNQNEKKLEILSQKYREMNEKLISLESENKTQKTAIDIYRGELKSKDKQIQKLKINNLQLE